MEKFCQSCGMPLQEALLDTEADGKKSGDYCKYCYDNGAFTGEMTMEEMIEFCAPHMMEGNPGMTKEAAVEAMKGFFPQLKRWKK